MQCPRCQAEVQEDETRCRFCGAGLAGARHAAAEGAPAAATAGPLRPAHGGPPGQRQSVSGGTMGKMPGETAALAGLICSLLGLATSCACVPLFPVGGALGYLALRDLPPDARRPVRLQAQIALWVGVGGTLLAVLGGLLLFVLMVAVGSGGMAPPA